MAYKWTINHKGIRFLCSLTFGVAFFSDQPKATHPCIHIYDLCRVWPHFYPMASPKKPSKACFPHVCLEVKLIFRFCAVQVSVCLGISLKKSSSSPGQLFLQKNIPGGSWRIFAGTGTHTHRELHCRGPEKMGGGERKKNKIKALKKLILLLFLPSVVCWCLLKFCCWAGASHLPTAMIQESWFSLLLMF